MKKLSLLLIISILSLYTTAQERGFIQARKNAKDHVALVIGNSAYPDMPLENPKNDAAAVAQTFTDMGFIVDKVIDADKEQMAMAIDRFRQKLLTARAAVFYFAGHGIQVKGENYLLPIGRTASTQISTEAQVPYRAINAGEVLTAMEQKNVKFSMVVLDACRNNPIKGKRRGKIKGLASIDAPIGSIVMYATKAGDVANDGTGKNSPFTTALIKHIKTPGLDVNLLPSRVTKTVLELTNNKQTPGSYVQLTESFTFVPEYTTEELATLKKQQKSKLTELQKQQKAAKFAQQREEPELEKQIENMKAETAGVGGDLDKMLAIVEQKEKKEAELKAVQQRIERKQSEARKRMEAKQKILEDKQEERKAKIRAMKKKDFEENLAKYNKIANSKFGQDMKEAAWNSLLDKYNIPKGSIEVGKIAILKLKVLDIEPKMVFIKGGTFHMGSNEGDDDEKPAHSVTISDFYIGKYEVTFVEYDAFCESTGREKPNDNGWGRGNRPVINVSWNDATAYCKWLSKQTNKNYSLPTEAEWEYAADGSSTHQKWAGTNGESSLSNYAWYDDNSGSKTHPVGSKSPNKLGLYDMSGNVWEWCSDWYKSDYYKNSPSYNPKGASNSSYRVVRGGGWGSNATYCRVAIRGDDFPTNSSHYIGFRVVFR